jgi:hypothetical protein
VYKFGQDSMGLALTDTRWLNGDSTHLPFLSVEPPDMLNLFSKVSCVALFS